MSTKKYYRARGSNAWSFDWVDTREEATADYFDAAKETQRKLNENYGLDTEIEETRDPYRGLSKVRYFPNRQYPRTDVGLATDSILARTDNPRHVAPLFELTRHRMKYLAFPPNLRFKEYVWVPKVASGTAVHSKEAAEEIKKSVPDATGVIKRKGRWYVVQVAQ